MSLAAGTRLGPYEVISPAGAGGMGEVYRAIDTSLKRTVALKVLPAAVAGEPDRLARFQREAEVLASLNHPNIAAIHGLETSGTVKALVMEFVEGPTLADRLAAGPMSPDEALPVATQIADALEAAHDRGIVHRDLKPANIKVRPDGTVKVLDFGLARSVVGSPDSSAARDGSDQAPTVTSPAMTALGMILGTASYMAPEQARGRPVDRRADIWAFGCVLYEMLTGRRAFAGDEITDVIAAVITRDPDLSALPADTPAHVRALIARCFVKDPRQRLRDIGEARLHLQGLAAPAMSPAATSSSSAAAPAAPARSSWLVPALSVALVLSLGTAAWLAWLSPPAASGPPTYLAIAFPAGAQLQKGQPRPSLAYSPDGRSLVYTARGRPDGNQLWMRRLDSYDPTPIPNTRDGRLATFSPDGRWIAFASGNTIRKIPITLDTPVDVVTHADQLRGLTWTDADEIVFSTAGLTYGLWRVPAAGGTPTLITNADVSYPDALPGGRAVVATAPNPAADQSSGDLTVVAVALADGQVTRLFDGGTYPRYVPTGHIAYLRGNTIMATSFDARALMVGDSRVAVVPGVFMDHAIASGNFAISQSGALAYTPGDAADFERSIVAIRPGVGASAPEPLIDQKRAYIAPRMSPDGRRIAVLVRAWKDRIWIIDVARQTFSRLHSTPLVTEGSPVWSPDGQEIVFRGTPEVGGPGLYRVAVDGTQAATRLYAGPEDPTPLDWTRDGRILLAVRQPDGDDDLMMVSLAEPGTLVPLMKTPFRENNAALSPDEKWLAYQSNRSGRAEIWVTAFPSLQSTVRVSIDGGQQPVWAPQGRRLYFRLGQQAIAVDLSGTGPLTPSAPLEVARVPSVIPTGFVTAMPDGRLLAIDGRDMGATPELRVILNWFTDLRARVR